MTLLLNIGKVLEPKNYECYNGEGMDLSCVKRAWICSGSSLTFLPRSWWEYLDWAKEARALANQITGGRSSPGMRVLLNFID